MKNLNYISEQIKEGKNLGDNLLKYARGMSSMYNTYAYIKLSMNYFTLFDMLCENDKKNEVFTKLWDRFNNFIKNCLLGNEENGLREVASIRNDIVKIMEVVTAYIDRLRIYEYVLNRVEYSFDEVEVDEEYYGTYFTNDIMHYILSDKENVVINSKISEIVGQLPVRMSKSKFFEYLNEAFTLYHGAQKRTIDDFAYSLRTVAMLQKIDGFEEIFPDIYEMYETLSNADYSNINKKEYDRLKKIFDLAAEKINDCADIFVLLAQVVNDAYTILLTQRYVIDDIEEVKTARLIIKQINDNYINNEMSYDDFILSGFTSFEGKQESISAVLSANDYIINYVNLNYKESASECNCEDAYKSLELAEKLQSGSDFICLEDDLEALKIPEDSYADMVCEQLIADIREDFKEKPVLVRRAVMSSILSQIPVFFNNVDEIVSYINSSLAGCSDKAEQAAVLEIVKAIIK